MKVTATHLQALRTAIEPQDTEARRQAYRERRIPRAEAVKDINVRYRWDLYYAAGGYRILDVASGTYNSDHLDTALRAIVPTL